MAVDTELISRLEKQAGKALPPVIYNIERGMINRFIRAIGDTNQLWQDEDCPTAPPGFVLTLGFIQAIEPLISDPSLAVLHGSTELECLQSIRAGDVITACARITSVRQRQGKSGLTVFLGLGLDYVNQRQETAARCSQMLIIY